MGTSKQLVLALMLLLGACSARQPFAPEDQDLLTGLALPEWLQGALAKAADVPIAQALVAEQGRVHLSFLGQIDPDGAEAWYGSSGTEFSLSNGRVVRSRFMEAELRQAKSTIDPVVRWLEGRAPLPAQGAKTVRSVQFEGDDRVWTERRFVLDTEISSAAIQAGAYVVVRLREEVRFDGWPQRYVSELWADAVTREVLWLRTVVEPGQPEVEFERAVPIIPAVPLPEPAP